MPFSISGIKVEPPFNDHLSTTFTSLLLPFFGGHSVHHDSSLNLSTIKWPLSSVPKVAVAKRLVRYNLVHFVSCVMFKCTSLSACKEIVSDNSGLVDFAIRPVRSILKLTGKWCFSGNSNHKGTVIKPAHQKFFFRVSWNDFWTSTR